MGFIKKQSTGFYLITALSAVLAVAGIAFYLVNCKTAYFCQLRRQRRGGGLRGPRRGGADCAIAASPGDGRQKALDVLFIAAAVLLAVAFVTFVGARVASIATIMIFENNASTMADLTSALVGLVCMVLAMVASIAASFCKVVKSREAHWDMTGTLRLLARGPRCRLWEGRETAGRRLYAGTI